MRIILEVLRYIIPIVIKSWRPSNACMYMGQVMQVWLSCYLILLSTEKTTNKTAKHSWPAPFTYMFVVVNFDALAQASDIPIERRQVVFLWWMQDSNLGSLRHLIASRLNAHSQTDWAIEDQAKNLELNSPSLWWVSIQPTWLHCRSAFAPGFGNIHVCCC